MITEDWVEILDNTPMTCQVNHPSPAEKPQKSTRCQDGSEELVRVEYCTVPVWRGVIGLMQIIPLNIYSKPVAAGVIIFHCQYSGKP